MKKLVFFFLIVALNLFLVNIGLKAQEELTDIDGNTYQTVVIGMQEWMAEDLKVARYTNGDALLQDQDHNQWQISTEGIWAYYDNDPLNNIYGKLYNWYATVDPRGLCPTGWRTPTDYDWQMLEEFIDPNDRGNKNQAGKKLKSRRGVNSPFGGDNSTNIHPRWDNHPENFGTDEFDFNALPGGGYTAGNAFRHKGQKAYYWSSTETVQNHAWVRILTFSDLGMSRGQFQKRLGASVRCVKGEEQSVQVPQVNTQPAINITVSSATCGGVVLADDGAPVNERGVVWSTTSNPSVANYLGITSEGSGLGTFSSQITGLESGITYWVRAYATNIAGTGYGIQVKLTTLNQIGLPTLITSPVSNIDSTNAVSGGIVISDGGLTVTARGVVWSTSQNPTIQSNLGVTADGTGVGIFYSSILHLSPGTDYFVRAYATSSEGTVYGNQFGFTSLNIITMDHTCPGIPTFTDPRDGKTYNTVLVGDQCWLRENLAWLPAVSPPSFGSTSGKCYYVYDYEGTDVVEAKTSDYYNHYGALYNWTAAMEACPTGWHLPSHNEWTELERDICTSGTCEIDFPYDVPVWGNPPPRGTNEGAKLKSCRQVDSPLGGECNTSENPRWNSFETYFGTNEYGFSALPSGYRDNNGLFRNVGNHVAWWSTYQEGSLHAWYRDLDYNSDYINCRYFFKQTGFSVRCIKD